MQKRDFTIVNRLGLHARAAAQLVQCVNAFQSDVYIEKEGEKVNAKSIMGILMLAAPRGCLVSVTIEGGDEDQAMEALAELINDGFGED